jgi:uncharacterized protein YndB with AHSA1/START domain
MSDEGEVVEREVFIGAAPEIVFNFLIDAELMARWIGVYHRLDPRPGGIFQVEVSQGNIARGTYTKVVPYRRVAFTWGWESRDPALAVLKPGASLVEFELEPKDGGTLVRLRHSRLPQGLSGVHGERWSFYLGRLAEVIAEDGQVNRKVR